MWAQGSLIAKVREGKAEEGKKYSDYFDFAEPFGRLKAHRVLAMFRAEKEEILDLTLNPNDEGFDAIAGTSLSASYEQPIADRFGIMDHGWPADKWLTDTVRWAWRTRILVHLGIDLRMRLWQSAEAEAVDVFAANLRDLLLAAPAGQRATMGLDPGFRTGVKVAVIDQTGKPVATHTIYPHVPQNKWDESLAILKNLADAAPRRADRDRQRHRLARDRQARDRPDQGQPRAQPDQDRRVRGGRLGLLRQRLRQRRAARDGRLAARRGLHRPAAPGPPGRAGQDRPEVDRRRPVPARRHRQQARALARRRGRGRGERGRGGRQHRQQAAAGPGLRHHRRPGRRDRRAPRRGRRVPHPRAPARRAPARPQGVRAVRRLPADPRRRQPARRLRRAPRGLPGRPPHPGEDPGRRRRADRRHQDAARPQPDRVHRRGLRPAHRQRHPQGAGEARPRPAARSSRPPPSPTACTPSATWSRA